MIKLKVPEMMCDNCVKRITKALKEADLKFSVSLENKTVTIDGAAAEAEVAAKKLDEIGYDTEKE